MNVIGMTVLGCQAVWLLIETRTGRYLCPATLCTDLTNRVDRPRQPTRDPSDLEGVCSIPLDAASNTDSLLSYSTYASPRHEIRP